MIIHKGATDLAYEISPMYRESLLAKEQQEAQRQARLTAKREARRQARESAAAPAGG